MKRTIVLLMAFLLILGAIPTSAEEIGELLSENPIVVTIDNGLSEGRNSAMNVLEDENGVDVDRENEKDTVFAESLNEAIMMLKSGRANMLVTLLPTAEYIVATDSELDIVPGVMIENLHMVAADAFEERMLAVNDAIASMIEDGTIDVLHQEHVVALLDGGQPETVEIPFVDGADTLTVGISGDIPPIDYISADGQPSGFNAAFLSELGSRMGVNIVPVVVESGARFAALQSGKIDTFFWQMQIAGSISGQDGKKPANIDNSIPEGLILSDPYWQAQVGILVKSGS